MDNDVRLRRANVTRLQYVYTTGDSHIAPILDNDHRIIGVCAGMPRKDENWDGVHHRAARLIEDTRHRLQFDKKTSQNRRGKFPAINVGISHGGGQP